MIRDLKNLKKQKWIIDGNYQKSIDIRLEAADTIIYLDFPKWLCLLQSIQRALSSQQPFDKVEGVKEQVSLKLIQFILKYPKQEMNDKLKKYKDNKKIFILHNRKEVEKLLASF